MAVEIGVGNARPSRRFTGAASALDASARTARETDVRIVEAGDEMTIETDNDSFQRYLRHNIRRILNTLAKSSERVSLAFGKAQRVLIAPRACTCTRALWNASLRTMRHWYAAKDLIVPR